MGTTIHQFGAGQITGRTTFGGLGSFGAAASQNRFGVLGVSPSGPHQFGGGGPRQQHRKQTRPAHNSSQIRCAAGCGSLGSSRTNNMCRPCWTRAGGAPFNAPSHGGGWGRGCGATNGSAAGVIGFNKPSAAAAGQWGATAAAPGGGTQKFEFGKLWKSSPLGQTPVNAFGHSAAASQQPVAWVRPAAPMQPSGWPQANTNTQPAQPWAWPAANQQHPQIAAGQQWAAKQQQLQQQQQQQQQQLSEQQKVLAAQQLQLQAAAVRAMSTIEANRTALAEQHRALAAEHKALQQKAELQARQTAAKELALRERAEAQARRAAAEEAALRDRVEQQARNAEAQAQLAAEKARHVEELDARLARERELLQRARNRQMDEEEAAATAACAARLAMAPWSPSPPRNWCNGTGSAAAVISRTFSSPPRSLRC